MELKTIVQKLSQYENGKYPVTSLYLKLEPEDRQNQQYKTKVKNLIKDLKPSLEKRGLDKPLLESIESDLKKISKYIESTSDISDCRGICVFSSSGNDLWEIYKLPTVYRNLIVVDRLPLVGQLIKINDEYSDIVSVILDRKKARIFRLQPDGAKEIEDYFYPGAARTRKFSSSEGVFKQRVAQGSAGNQAHGYGEHAYNRIIENEIHQHYKYVADKLFYYYQDNKFKWLVVGGTEKNVSEFSNHLHSYLRDILAGTAGAEVDTIKPSEVMFGALTAIESRKSEKQNVLLKEYEEKQGPGLTVNGPGPTLEALSKGQIRVLFVEEGFTLPGFICPESRVLFVNTETNECPEGVEPEEIADIVDYVIEEAFKQGAELEFLKNEQHKDKIRGLGGILRFK